MQAPYCGARYKYQWMDYPAGDKGRKNVEGCDGEVLQWDGRRDYYKFVQIAPLSKDEKIT